MFNAYEAGECLSHLYDVVRGWLISKKSLFSHQNSFENASIHSIKLRQIDDLQLTT